MLLDPFFSPDEKHGKQFISQTQQLTILVSPRNTCIFPDVKVVHRTSKRKSPPNVQTSTIRWAGKASEDRIEIFVNQDHSSIKSIKNREKNITKIQKKLVIRGRAEPTRNHALDAHSQATIIQSTESKMRETRKTMGGDFQTPGVDVKRPGTGRARSQRRRKRRGDLFLASPLRSLLRGKRGQRAAIFEGER